MIVLSTGHMFDESLAKINSKGQMIIQQTFYGEYIHGSAHGSDKPFSVGHVPEMPVGRPRWRR